MKGPRGGGEGQQGVKKADTRREWNEVESERGVRQGEGSAVPSPCFLQEQLRVPLSHLMI